ncbi:ctf8 domain-containing protein [Hirsutella rhossiliensis]|uniref:Ctf8 domain-containing protein n=1 Tax=Hirsutella rhossiliensis TaxID=111463 RepID=A0A9P8SN81_9HYPO|nr:ctf8 domain-containing protein [Hirsutella rhossiliensis]KAH0966906.1 ctf8 domain-containing protein [Hirsutella rhossiliensis]
MTSVKLYPPSKPAAAASSPLPQLLQTPSGLALLELQGSVNLPSDSDGTPLQGVEIGKLDFPDYVAGVGGSAWMKRVHLYIGQHQRLTGEVKKLPKALAVVRRRENQWRESSDGPVQEQGDNLDVVEIIKYKLMFSNRPEPVGTANAT